MLNFFLSDIILLNVILVNIFRLSPILLNAFCRIILSSNYTSADYLLWNVVEQLEAAYHSFINT
jgi:hypothetical protein